MSEQEQREYEAERERRQLWRDCFVEAFKRSDNPKTAGTKADEAVVEFNRRLSDAGSHSYGVVFHYKT